MEKVGHTQGVRFTDCMKHMVESILVDGCNSRLKLIKGLQICIFMKIIFTNKQDLIHLYLPILSAVVKILKDWDIANEDVGVGINDTAYITNKGFSMI